jgi:acyl-CoA synthetase (AMP-forming)/AMP-acid ligase II
MKITDVYTILARERPDAKAITYHRSPFQGHSLTWAELAARANAWEGELLDANVVSDSRCAVVMSDHPDFIPALLGVWLRGAVAVLVDPEWGEVTQQNVLRHSGSDVVVDPRRAQRVSRLSPRRPAAPPFPPDTALVAYTSGSTGSPKAIPLRHERILACLYASASTVVDYRQSTPQRIASSMRVSGYGVLIMHYLWSAVFASEVVVLPRLTLATVSDYWSDIERHEIDQAVIVPPHIELLVRGSRAAAIPTRPLFLSSSGPISGPTYSRFVDRFNCPLLNCYGLSETTYITSVGDTDVRGQSTVSIGRPYMGRMRVRDVATGRLTSTGPGEIEVSTPSACDGYYDNDSANEHLFSADGWLRTGDLGRVDETGRYRVVGRLKDAVMKGGHTIYLTDVEEAAMSLTNVLECVAVRVDLPGSGEDAGIIAVRKPGSELNTNTVRQVMVDYLGEERAPRKVFVIDYALPRIGQSKIDREAARKLWDELTTSVGRAIK